MSEVRKKTEEGEKKEKIGDQSAKVILISSNSSRLSSINHSSLFWLFCPRGSGQMWRALGRIFVADNAAAEWEGTDVHEACHSWPRSRPIRSAVFLPFKSTFDDTHRRFCSLRQVDANPPLLIHSSFLYVITNNRNAHWWARHSQHFWCD